MSNMKSNDLVAKLFETLESNKKAGNTSSEDLDSSDSESGSSISLSLSSSEDKSKSKSSSKKSKKTKKTKKKKKSSSKKKKRKHSSSESSDESDNEKSRKSAKNKKKKKHSKDKNKDRDDKEALHKKLRIGKHSTEDGMSNNKRKTSTEETEVASKKTKLDKSSEKSKSTNVDLNEAILGAIEKEMTTSTISEILDDLLGGEKSKLNEKKLLEESLLSINIKKEKEDPASLTTAFNVKKEKIDEHVKKSSSRTTSDKSADKSSEKKKGKGSDQSRPKENGNEKSSSERKKSDKDKENDSDKSNEGKIDDDMPLPPVADVFVEDLLASKVAPEIVKPIADKPKPAGKITIGNLKQPTVFKEIEDKEKERRSKYEDGEITSSEKEDGDDSKSESRKEKKKKSSSKSKKGDRSTRHRKYRSNRSRDTSRSRSSRSRSRDKDRTKDKSSSSYHGRSRHNRRHGRDSRSRSGSRDRTRTSGSSRDGLRDRSRDRNRDRSKDRGGRESRRDRKRRGGGNERRQMSLSLSPAGRHKSKSPIDSATKIDKRKLLEIARKNAVTMMKDGVIAKDKRKLISWRAGGQTVNELTDFCKLLSQKGEASDSSESEDSKASEEEAPFLHPFEIKQRPDHIVMNIKNAQALRTRTFQEKNVEQSKTLSLQFPVSSGTQHRRTESEWVPVVTTSVPAITAGPGPPSQSTALVSTTGTGTTSALPAPVAPLSFSDVAFPGAPPLTMQTPTPVPMPGSVPAAPRAIEQAAAPPDPVFTMPNPDVQNMDIGSVVSQRLKAMRRLAENPNDSEAQMQMYHAQKKMQAWAESKQMPGQFTGSTEVRILTPQELASGNQAWARKEQFQQAAPLTGGMGMHLLQKMGWSPGEGLGKNKEGTLTPLALDIKFDKRGLVSKEELPPVKKNPYVYRRGMGMGGPGPRMSGPGEGPGPGGPPRFQGKPTQLTLDGKHPVSLLHEYCMRRKLGIPQYDQASETGPPHRKNFVFKVTINGTEYQPAVSAPNKKQAKAEAAQAALMVFGLIT
uniref:Protein SON n=1 Tax=Cacopsylla melanoneura TaxID=428564 RepID=A0A8D8TVC6_9HEMI